MFLGFIEYIALIGDVAGLQYYLYKEDTARIAEIGANAHSFHCSLSETELENLAMIDILEWRSGLSTRYVDLPHRNWPNADFRMTYA
jgi:hypothetical protein